jgi:hypothetical protein
MQLELIDTVSLLEQSIDDYKIQFVHFEDQKLEIEKVKQNLDRQYQ